MSSLASENIGETPVERAARLRAEILSLAPKGKRRKVAKAIGELTHTALNNFLDDPSVVPHESTMNRMEIWLAKVASEGTEEDDGREQLEEVLVEEIRRIARLDEPESRKMLYRDGLASLMSRVWGYAAERAAEARAKAIQQGESAAQDRATVVSSSVAPDASAGVALQNSADRLVGPGKLRSPKKSQRRRQHGVPTGDDRGKGSS